MKRDVRIDGDVAYVPLTQGYEAVIDAADVHLISGWNWTAQVKPRNVYAFRTDYSGPRPRKVWLHRLIAREPDGLQVDHVDCDGLNNRRRNLRVATHDENARNARRAVINTSGFKGVSRMGSKWMARIHLNGKDKYLGCFPNPEDAHAAYCDAAILLRGKFGRTE